MLTYVTSPLVYYYRSVVNKKQNVMKFPDIIYTTLCKMHIRIYKKKGLGLLWA